MTAEYTLTMHGYCGMAIPIAEGNKDDCRQAAARYIRSLRRQGFPVVTLETGTEWESQEPEDCCLVPAECGVLHLRAKPVPTFRCWECGEDVPQGESCDCRLCCDCGEDRGCCSCFCRDCGEYEDACLCHLADA